MASNITIFLKKCKKNDHRSFSPLTTDRWSLILLTNDQWSFKVVPE
jgi:hypothetical protein